MGTNVNLFSKPILLRLKGHGGEKNITLAHSYGEIIFSGLIERGGCLKESHVDVTTGWIPPAIPNAPSSRGAPSNPWLIVLLATHTER